MKRATNTSSRRTTLLTMPELTAVLGGHDGTIIVENVVPRPRGITGGGSLPGG